jgi:hypothetical protein
MAWPGIEPCLCGEWSVTNGPNHDPAPDASLRPLHKHLIFLYLQFVSTCNYHFSDSLHGNADRPAVAACSLTIVVASFAAALSKWPIDDVFGKT